MTLIVDTALTDFVRQRRAARAAGDSSAARERFRQSAGIAAAATAVARVPRPV